MHFMPSAALERRAEMKQLIIDTLQKMWGEGDASLVPVYYSESYVQHNPDMPGGYHRIKEIVETEIPKYIAETGGPFLVDVRLIGAVGDMGCIHYNCFMAGINRRAGARSSGSDIFRIGPDNRWIEHWDVLEIEGESLPDERTLF
jgi:predicted SnoaL-like aldol condensation-catalyzing enzyme